MRIGKSNKNSFINNLIQINILNNRIKMMNIKNMLFYQTHNFKDNKILPNNLKLINFFQNNNKNRFVNLSVS